jgi:hypothetical protein
MNAWMLEQRLCLHFRRRPSTMTQQALPVALQGEIKLTRAKESVKVTCVIIQGDVASESALPSGDGRSMNE